MSKNKPELSTETLKRALEAANKAYPDNNQRFKECQAYYLGICHEAQHTEKLESELEQLKAENSKMRKENLNMRDALQCIIGRIEGVEWEGLDMVKAVQKIKDYATEALKTNSNEKDIRQFLHYYLGCEIAWDDGIWEITSMSLHSVSMRCVSSKRARHFHGQSLPEGSKIILRKLESMMEEEAQELLKVRFNHPWQNPIYQRHSSVCIDFKFSSGPGEFSESQLDWDMLNSESFHYLLSRGFDLFGLIDAGLALDKQTLTP